jgi:leader peptidase (prepilin peptidase) / N-methyltransferase
MSLHFLVTMAVALTIVGVCVWSVRRELNAPWLACAEVAAALPVVVIALNLLGARLDYAIYFGCLIVVCVLICEVDRRTFIIPNVLVGLLVLIALTAPFVPPRVYQVLGALLAGAIFVIIREGYFLLKREHGLGLGDVKLAAAMGALLGPTNAFVAIGVAAAVTAGILLASSQRENSQKIAPFGVGLAAALALTVVVETWA